MDPVSALGVAAAVVQFVDFTSTLISGTAEIYRSTDGHTQSNSELKTVAASLNSLNNELRQSLARTPSSRRSPRGQELASLCRSCTVVADELIAVLDQLSKQDRHEISLWSSFRTALRMVWSQEKIDGLQRRLDSFRQQISMHILVSLRESIASQSKDTLRETQKLSQQLLNHTDQNNKLQSDIIDAINRSHWDQNASTHAPSEQLEGYDKQRFFQRLLSRLKYKEMENRYEAIVEAYTQTFEWIFRPPPKEQRWASFIDWLHSPEPLYWITGKPGAAKSTLVKFLCDDRRTMEHLGQWVDGSGDELFVSSFYFWCSGTEMQMSQEGLLRTLLHDALLRLPYLTPVVFANRLETCMIFGETVALQEPWTWKELLQAFGLFCQEARKPCHRVHPFESHPPRRLVFFIDGLDEFGGNHSNLVKFIKGLVDTNIKICVSSRPWNIFEDAFKHTPSLRLEDLTFVDIKHYVTSKLSANPGFAPLLDLEPMYASQLVQNVTVKACGVFLWVYLVTESLIEGLSDGERLSDLQRRLDSLPADLEKLFLRMLDSLDAHHFERGSQLFQIFRAAIAPLSVLQLSFADEGDSEKALPYTMVAYTKEQRNSKAEIMRRRLNACCKGLLEVQQDLKGTIYTFRISSTELADAPIGYLHRTVKDFLQKPDVWCKLLDATPDFNPNLRLSEAYVLDLKTSHADQISLTRFWDAVTYGIEHAVRSDPSCSASQVRLLDEIDRAAGNLTTAKDQNGTSFLEKCSMPTEPPVAYWTCIKNQGSRRTSFLHLATVFQLVTYVTIRLQEMPPAKRTAVATSLLEIAVKDSRTSDVSKQQTSIYHEEANADMVCTLLDCGAEIYPDVLTTAQQRFPSNPEVTERLILCNANRNKAREMAKKENEASKVSHSFKRMFRLGRS